MERSKTVEVIAQEQAKDSFPSVELGEEVCKP